MPKATFRYRNLTFAIVIATAILFALSISAALGTEASKGPIRLGVLTTAWGPPAPLAGMVDGLSELGYRENEDYVIAVWFAEGDAEALPGMAAEMLEAGVDMIVAVGPLETDAAAEATNDIPIISLYVGDPVAHGLIESYARPGGNITGVADAGFGISRRRLQVFSEIVPDIRRVLVPFNATDPHQALEAEELSLVADSLGLMLVTLPLEDVTDLEQIEALVWLENIDGILAPGAVDLNIPGVVLDISKRMGLPAMFQHSEYVEVGGLASFGAASDALGWQAARFIDKIIQGQSPANIPVERPESLELVINLRTAANIGLSITQVVLFQADRILR